MAQDEEEEEDDDLREMDEETIKIFEIKKELKEFVETLI